jgi:LacI family transcriptional regulator
VKSAGSITMRDLARQTGVAVSTVSKALRNDPSIPLTRCRQIQAAARRLGYRPNPLVAALMAQLHHRRRRTDPLMIAWIDLWSDPESNPVVNSAAALLTGARQRARELGYGIELYPAGRQELSPQRLHRMLTARGQWGMIIPPVPAMHSCFPIDLRGLAAVTIGTSLHEPVMHRISPNHFQGCALAFERLREHGFRRIGLAISPDMNLRVEGKWLGAFLAASYALPGQDRIPPCLAATGDEEATCRWRRRYQPEAVIQAEPFHWLGAESPAIVLLLPLPGIPHVGRVDHRPDQLGRVAVEAVVAQIHRHERGSPETPQTVLIEGLWRAEEA